jgi:hypothetical protein
LNINKEKVFVKHHFWNIRKGVAKGGRKFKTPNTTTDGSLMDDEKNAIWITLVFQMLCWNLLYDFDNKDVMRVRGSRMLVYIG